MIDNSIQELVPLERKTRVQFLGVLLDSNLNWLFHMDNIALKISKMVGRHSVPLSTLISI